jgi:hypothetical protein
MRNIINTARQLARYKGVKLRYAHVNQAVGVVNEFKKYVTDLHGHSDEEHARDSRQEEVERKVERAQAWHLQAERVGCA